MPCTCPLDTDCKPFVPVNASHSVCHPPMQVHRDKSGKEVSEEELRAAKDAEKKAKEWVAPEWAGGIAQQRQAEAHSAELAAQASQPFARRRWVPPYS
jgi:Pre-mRNA-splicing factor of RES complex